MSTLFEIADEVRTLTALIEQAGEEPTPEALAALDAWFAELRRGEHQKIDGYVSLIRDRQLVAAARTEEAERHLKAAKVAENLVKRLKESLLVYMIATGQDEINTRRNTVRVQNNGGQVALRVDVDPHDLPSTYRRTTTTIEADRDRIRAALDAGVEIDGCRLEKRGKQLRIT